MSSCFTFERHGNGQVELDQVNFETNDVKVDIQRRTFS